MTSCFVNRLPGTDRDVNRWILFTVRTHLDRIDSFDASTAKALHDAIRGTDPEELEYKSLGDDKLAAVVTKFLAERAGLPTQTETDTADQDETVHEGVSLKDPANSAVPSGGRCPFFKGAEGGAEGAKAKGEANGEAAADEDSKKSKAEATAAVNEDEEDEETKRIDAATRAGIEPWTSASLGVAAANTPPASWYHDLSGTVPVSKFVCIFVRVWAIRMMVCFVYRRPSNETCLDAGGPGPAGSIRLPTTETISSAPRVPSSTSWSGARMAFYERFTTRVGACTSFYFPRAIRMTTRVFCSTRTGITRWRWRPRLGTSRVRILRPPICQLNASPHRARSVSSVRITGGPTTWRVR